MESQSKSQNKIHMDSKKKQYCNIKTEKNIWRFLWVLRCGTSGGGVLEYKKRWAIFVENFEIDP